MTHETKDLPPLPEKSYLGDDVSYGYEAWDMHAYALEAIRASAISAPEHGWLPIETAPKQGVFLVYLPTESEDYRVQNMTRRHKMTTIGDAFSFDKAPATHWQPLPPPPGTTSRGGDAN